MLEAAHLFRAACTAWESGWLPPDDPDVRECTDKAEALTRRAKALTEKVAAATAAATASTDENDDACDDFAGDETDAAAAATDRVLQEEAGAAAGGQEAVAITEVLEKRSFMSKMAGSFKFSRMSFRSKSSTPSPTKKKVSPMKSPTAATTPAASKAGGADDEAEDDDFAVADQYSPPSSDKSSPSSGVAGKEKGKGRRRRPPGKPSDSLEDRSSPLSPASPLFGRRSTSFSEKEADALLAKALQNIGDFDMRAFGGVDHGLPVSRVANRLGHGA